MGVIMSSMNATGARIAPPHEHLLLVALGPRACRADRWRRLHDRREQLQEPGASQLLPLLGRSLVEAGVDDPELPRLEQAASQAWLSNQLLVHRLGGALDVLAAAGVRTMALKGVPLALGYYQDLSLRPMGDFDVLVEAEAAPTAIDALRAAGWTLEWRLPPDFVSRTYEMPLRPPGHTGILDLHWRLAPWIGRSADAPDPALWEAATPLEVGDHITLAPAPHDLLLNVIQHAYKSGWAEVPRWVADAVVLLRSSRDALDWDIFVDRVASTALALPVGDALSYVTVTFDAPVPAAVVAALTSRRATRRERRKHRVAQRPLRRAPQPVLGGAEDLRIGWARTSINYSRAGAAKSLSAYLRGRMHVERLWTLPFLVIARRVRRAWRHVR